MKVVSALKLLLGSDYAAFSDNFDVFGQPSQTKEGGLFVEGWLKDLYLYQASAFVIQPDGKLYAAWLSPENDYIKYITNDAGESKIQKDIQQWSSRFDGVGFNYKPAKIQIKQKIPDVSHFDTKNYSATITLLCPDHSTLCTKALLKITDKRDASSHAVLGLINSQECNKPDCPVKSLQFENKNTKTRYVFSLNDDVLFVSTQGKEDIYEKGQWH
ncbi:hypothetical protein HA50_12260 [Pantoea cypripedii]|uniref:Uncharacterized protein n=1 Tax=Pantoea cypripedii TaxID=55209 RepID=A0A1X1EW12_PANCY|nr:hypothetical protein HA50_12260 [Pantoea cypripedii]